MKSTESNQNHSNQESLLLGAEHQPPEDWEALLLQSAAADYFHTAHWTCCIQDHYSDATAFWLTVRWNGRLVGGLAGVRKSKPVSRWESNLEGTSGGPLLDDALPSDLKARVFLELVSAYLKLRGNGFGTTCLSLNHQQEREFGAMLRGGDVPWKHTEVPAAVISLAKGLEYVEMSLMKKNKRNERNRALRRDAKVIITRDPELVAAYYPIYARASERWNLPPAPLPFLQALLEDPVLLSSGQHRSFFTCLMFEDKVIGGHLNLQYGDRVIAWNGVTDPAFARTHFPATLAVWGDIEESCRRRASILDLGGSGGVVSLDGFKKHFGAISELKGHYVLDSAGLNLLREGRKLLRGLRSGKSFSGPQRWHDRNPEEESGS